MAAVEVMAVAAAATMGEVAMARAMALVEDTLVATVDMASVKTAAGYAVTAVDVAAVAMALERMGEAEEAMAEEAAVRADQAPFQRHPQATSGRRGWPPSTQMRNSSMPKCTHTRMGSGD